MTRRTRSPLQGASRSDIAALRAVIVANLAWERALGTPAQYLSPDEPIEALMSLSFRTVDVIRQRSVRRWEGTAHFEQSRAIREDQWLKRYSRSAWEQEKLREEVAGMRAELDQMRGRLP